MLTSGRRRVPCMSYLRFTPLPYSASGIVFRAPRISLRTPQRVSVLRLLRYSFLYGIISCTHIYIYTHMLCISISISISLYIYIFLYLSLYTYIYI